MVPIQTKEHLVYFMQCGMLRLSRYDLHFVQNMHLLLVNNSTVTTNQVALFEKIISKYMKQLNKHGITDTKLNQLNWETIITPSDKKFTEAYISIDGEKIIFKSPFNKKFLQKFNTNDFNPFKWIKDCKHYESLYSAEALKFLIKATKDFYPIINYCPVTQKLINNVKQFDALYWEPTLINVNGRYIIAAINNAIFDAINNIELSNTPECLFLLSTLGIKIDEKIINNDPLLKFASEYFAEIDYTDLDDFIFYLKTIKCDSVFTVGLVLLPHYKKNLFDKLKESNIYVDDKVNMLLDQRLKGKINPVVIYMATQNVSKIPSKFKKIIKMTNGSPVNLI